MADLAIPSDAALYDTFKAAVLAKDQSGRLSEQSFSAGYLFDILAGSSSLLGQEILQQVLLWHRDTFFRTAEGDGLDRLVEDHLGFRRQEGVGALGRVRFSRPQANAGDILIPAGAIVRTVAGTRFLTTADTLLIGLSTEAEVRAEEIGPAGNVQAETVVRLVTPLPDSSISVTNPERMSGGRERETDAQLRERAQLFYETLSRGTLQALEFAARTVPGVALAVADDTQVPPRLYIADVTSSANSALAAQVAAVLPKYRAAGIPVGVFPASAVDQPIEVTVQFSAGGNSLPTRQQIVEAVVRAVNGLAIGEALHPARVIGAVMSIAGVSNCDLSNPAGSVIPTPEQVLRTSAELVRIL